MTTTRVRKVGILRDVETDRQRILGRHGQRRGMMRPNMATHASVIVTDAALSTSAANAPCAARLRRASTASSVVWRYQYK